MIDLEKKDKFRFQNAEQVIDAIAYAYMSGTGVGWDGARNECFFLMPDIEDADGNFQRPKCDPNDPVSSCAVGVLLRRAGISAAQLWDDGVRNEHTADSIVATYGVTIADWDAKRVGRFLQLCQCLHDRFAGSNLLNCTSSKALGSMFLLMGPSLVMASAEPSSAFACQVRQAINTSFATV